MVNLRFRPFYYVSAATKRWRLFVALGMALVMFTVAALLIGRPKFISRSAGDPNAPSLLACSRDYLVERKADLKIVLNRTWHVVGAEIVTAQPIQVSATFPEPEECSMQGYTAQISVPQLEVSQDRSAASLSNFTVNIDPTQTPIGTYKADVTIKFEDIDVIKAEKSFHVSKPVYVAWTFDWEGYGFPLSYLKEFENVAKRTVTIPITHFFNPRYFTSTSVTPSVANAFKQWVLSRRNTYGDEIGLHLHMFYDFVEAAGVTPREQPNWNNRGTGSDVPFSAYTEDEQRAILEFSLKTLNAAGITGVTSFRAGGWFTDEVTLAVLDELGFKIDSSGRTAARLGGFLPVPWNLSSTTQPYVPCTLDQNKSCPRPGIVLAELPNNGGDSAQFTSEQMITRFYENYNRKPLATHKAITYLTHPEAWGREKTRIIPVLDEIDKHSYARDAGPVIYSSLNTIYQAWQTNKYWTGSAQ